MAENLNESETFRGVPPADGAVAAEKNTVQADTAGKDTAAENETAEHVTAEKAAQTITAENAAKEKAAQTHDTEQGGARPNAATADARTAANDENADMTGTASGRSTDNVIGQEGTEEYVKEEKGEKKEKKEGKKRELQKQVEGLTAELSEEKDRYARMFAEYENFRRRSQKERENVYADAYAEALGEIMPMVDNLERALQCGEGEQLRRGLEMVMNQFHETLQKLGIEAFGEKGDTFDPNIHHAIMHEEDETLPENSVTEVFQRGYKKGERIIRCAMVKVAN